MTGENVDEVVAEVLESSLFNRSPVLRQVLLALDRRRKRGQGAWAADEMAEELYPKKQNAADTLRVNIRRTKKLLNKYYVWKEHRQGEACAVIQRPEHGFGYQLCIEPYPADYSGHKLQDVDRFWSQLWMKILNAPDVTEPKMYITFSNESDPVRTAAIPEPPGLRTGTGEVVGSYFLGRLFANLFPEYELDPQLIRSSAIEQRLEEAHRIFIFIGSSLAIRSLRELREYPELKSKQRFFFRWCRNANGDEIGMLEDTAPEVEKDQPAFYICETENDWAYIDYALVSYLYDESKNHAIVNVGGLSTLGTEKAVKIVSDNNNGYAKQIFQEIARLTGAANRLTEFEAVFRVPIKRGIPDLKCKLVAFSTPEILARRLGKASIPRQAGKS